MARSGSITGEANQARQLARTNFKLFPDDVDAIIANAAGCGSGIREYGLLFAGEPEEATAQAFAAQVQRMSASSLMHWGWSRPPRWPSHLL